MIRCDYQHLKPGELLPNLDVTSPFLAIICIEAENVPTLWRAETSSWLVENGCLYAMAWGVSCSEWDDAIDEANLEAFDYGDVPEEKFVMTTWHEDEPLSEVLWFAKNFAQHPTVTLSQHLLVHVTDVGREAELLRLWKDTAET